MEHKVMSDEEFERRSAEDFKLLVLCEMKRNMGMYQMLKDRELIAERQRRAALSKGA
jgi:hypothetical protein